MKKRKPPEQGRPEFNNNPFTSLKKLKPSIAAPRQPAPQPARKTAREDREDEEDLFRRAMSGTRRLGEHGEEAPSVERAHGRAVPPPAAVEDEQQQFLRAMQKMGSTLRVPPAESDLEGPPRQSASARMKQLKRGTIRIGAELDLHGCLRDEALARLRQFLSGCAARGQKAVLVITGKGINSPEGPVLQGAVADWLRGPGRNLVAEFGPAPRDKGGSGAYVVFLRNAECGVRNAE